MDLHDTSEKGALDPRNEHSSKRQTACAPSPSTAEVEIGSSPDSDIETGDMRLPLELWREIIREAGAIQNEFGPFRSEWDDTEGKLYLARWDKIFQTRLSLALVCRSWHSVALQYLYSSLVFRDRSSLMPTVTRLGATNLAQWVQRVTLFHPVATQDRQSALEYLPNLRFLQFSYEQAYFPIIFNLPSLCRHITSLENISLSTEWAMTLSELPNLQYLRCKLASLTGTCRPIILSQLQTLDISLDFAEPWPQSILLPNLRALHVTHAVNSHTLHAVLAAHLCTIHTFAFSPQYHFVTPPTALVSAPHLRELLIQKAHWTSLDRLSWIPLGGVEIIHLPLEHEVLENISLGKQAVIDHLSTLLHVTRDPAIVPRLHTICTDLTSNTLTLAGSLIREYLEAWVGALAARNVQVFTRVCETVLDDPRRAPLARVLDAPPNFEFWPPCLAYDGDLHRWRTLAHATGRRLMGRKVKNNWIECEWIGPES